MKIWRVIIKEMAEGLHCDQTYWGEADTYVEAGDKALGLALLDGFKEPWVDEVGCFGEKSF